MDGLFPSTKTLAKLHVMYIVLGNDILCCSLNIYKGWLIWGKQGFSALVSCFIAVDIFRKCLNNMWSDIKYRHQISSKYYTIITLVHVARNLSLKVFVSSACGSQCKDFPRPFLLPAFWFFTLESHFFFISNKIQFWLKVFRLCL